MRARIRIRHQPCLQFRFDDDDAVAGRFHRAGCARRRLTARHCLNARPTRSRFDWNRGYLQRELSAEGIAATEYYRAALFRCGAWQCMSKAGGSRKTIMNFAHEKIPQFMHHSADGDRDRCADVRAGPQPILTIPARTGPSRA